MKKRLLFIGILLVLFATQKVHAQSYFYDEMKEHPWILTEYEPNHYFKQKAIYLYALRYDKKYIKKSTFYCEFGDEMVIYHYNPETQNEVQTNSYAYSVEQGKRGAFVRIFLDKTKNKYLDYDVGITSTGYMAGLYRRKKE